MTDSTPRPPAPGPRPPVPGPRPPERDGRELRNALDTLSGLDPQDLDGVLAAAEEAHRRLRDRLGHAGGR